MKIVSNINDNRIKSTNILIELTIEEYLAFARKIISNNELQRLKIRASKTIYSLLKDDLLTGCIMPAIVLAITDESKKEFTDEELKEYLSNNYQNVLILDGLQRTYTLIDALNTIKAKKTVFDFESGIKEEEKFLNQLIRVEIYININKFGILYRMLTLNTGQTPMSIRHQLEMLYSDYSNVEVDGIKIISDNEGTVYPENNQFKFQTIIEGFNSYINRDELPMDRQEMLENLKILEKITKEDLKTDIFREFIQSYARLFNKLRELTDDYCLLDDELIENGIQSPFGKNVSKIFSSSQALTGFGAAIGNLKDKLIIKDFDQLNSIIEKLQSNSNKWLFNLVQNMDQIKRESKKIGNGQRLYFKCFFRVLFNSLNDTFCDLEESVIESFTLYNSLV